MHAATLPETKPQVTAASACGASTTMHMAIAQANLTIAELAIVFLVLKKIVELLLKDQYVFLFLCFALLLDPAQPA
ncbi:hypothetical protein, partial [Arthrobacter sp. GMC3]|uniref:hypothetical protein n=1 Tax=Arthrobacter sp. GMC3 TaxID=2058894 RepID=UPI001CA5BC41